MLVWTSTPDPITIMSTGKSIGSWLGGACWAAMPGIRCFPWQARAIKLHQWQYQAHGGIVDGKLRFGGEESTVGSNRALLVSNFTVDTRGFQYLRFKYYTENNNVPANAPSLGIGPAGWSETVNASVSLIKQNGTSAVQTVTLNLSNYQGYMQSKGKWGFSGNTNNNPYWAGRKCWVTEIYMYA